MVILSNLGGSYKALPYNNYMDLVSLDLSTSGSLSGSLIMQG